MPQLQAYCSKPELDEYNKLDSDTKEAINKRTRLFWADLVKKARGDNE